MKRKIRILVAKPGLDGHDRGALVLCEVFKEAGMEVIYTGVYQTPEMIVEAAIAEDVEVVALSLMDGLYLTLFPEVVHLLREKGAEGICIVAGGIIAEEDRPVLEAMGITGNFGPGTPIQTIIDHVRERVRQRRAEGES